jgi:hypothetical protein
MYAHMPGVLSLISIPSKSIRCIDYIHMKQYY